MEVTLFIAKLVGAWMIIQGLVMVLRHKSMVKTLDDFFANRGIAFVAGFMLTVIGLVLVITHNVWEWSVLGLITLINWIILLKGIMYMGFPGKMKKFRKGFSSDAHWLIIGGFFTLAIGLYIARFGFGW